VSETTPRDGGTMKAVVLHRYGIPEKFMLEDVPVPELEEGRVLVRVKAASLNAIDKGAVTGKPTAVRMLFGLTRPKVPTPCRDMAGVVEAVGKGVTRFKPGDEVFGVCLAACAEYGSAKEAKIAPKPAGLTFEEAASLPVAGLTALIALRDKAQLQPGQRVLINGASGGVGCHGILVAKALGAHVTGVCSTSHVDRARSLGADEVIDRSKEDFTKSGKQFDVIFDNGSCHSLFAIMKVMAPNGTMVFVGAPGSMRFLNVLRLMLRAALFARFSRRKKFSLCTAKVEQSDLDVLRELIESGKMSTAVDRVYPLSEAADAFRYLADGHADGKIVVTM
jgi:NADPH:quinone reductase-like Zn-dependent oxidoreductase